LTVEGDEDLVDFVAGLVICGTSGHHVEELGELDLSATVLVEFGNHLIDCLSLGLDAEGVDGDLEFWVMGVVPLGSMAPPKSRSKRSKAFLISRTSSRVT
jgi:hypothetical protein